MKKFVLPLLCIFLLTGCGVGSYSVSSGISDTALISFRSQEKFPVIVEVDGQQYRVKTVKVKPYKADRKIKQTALNSVSLDAGQHLVKVMDGNMNVIFEKKLVLSASEHRIVEL